MNNFKFKLETAVGRRLRRGSLQEAHELLTNRDFPPAAFQILGGI